MSAQRGLPRSQCLPNSQAFATVLATAYKSHSPMFSVFATPNRLAHARIGLTVSRRVSPKAVVRNRIKRCIRESFRHHQQLLVGRDVVVIAKPRAGAATNSEMGALLEQHWENIRKQCEPS